MANVKLHLGYKRNKMIDISTDSIVIDILHEFLRVTDVLVDLLLDELFRLDKFLSTTKYDPKFHLNIASIAKFLQLSKLKKLKPGLNMDEIRAHFKRFTGVQKRIIFERMNQETMTDLFKAVYKITEVEKLWKTYWDIFHLLRSEYIYKNGDHIRKKSKEFLKIFTSIYNPNKVTPYIHILCHHMGDLYDKYGPLNYFSAQGLEKLNDMTTKQFFSCTNKHRTYPKQILERDYRVAEYEQHYRVAE